MLYKRGDLPKNVNDDGRVAITRYMYKFQNRRNEIKKLKWHEKDWLFSHMRILVDKNNHHLYDIFKIEEAKDFAFYWLILIYLGNQRKIDFSKPAFDYDGIINKKRQNFYKSLFWENLNNWEKQLYSRCGEYISILKPMYDEKLKELVILKNTKQITKQVFIERKNYMTATFYYVYYLVRCFFDELPTKCIEDNVCGFLIYADIYTFCHVLTRHYFPTMNKNIGGTLNEDMPFINIKEIPLSLLSLVKKYCTQTILTQIPEYMLFILDGNKYILWIQSKKDTKRFQIRSFYKCEEQIDLDKYNNMRICNIEKGMDIAIPYQSEKGKIE